MRLCECNTVNACNVPRTTRAGSGAAKGSGSRFLYLVYSAWDVFDTEQVGKAGTRTGSTEFNFSFHAWTRHGRTSVCACAFGKARWYWGLNADVDLWICGLVHVCVMGWGIAIAKQMSCICSNMVEGVIHVRCIYGSFVMRGWGRCQVRSVTQQAPVKHVMS
jgi:hypothetical protein